MQQLLRNGWVRRALGIILFLFGIGGLVAGLLGHTSNSVRYLIGGIVLALIGTGNIIIAREMLQKQRL